jgi:hypothetical protein
MRWFFALLLVTGAAFAQSPPPQQLAQPKDTEQPATKDNRGTEKTPFVVKVIPTPKPDYETAQEVQAHIQKAGTDIWIERWTGAVALFTLILAGVGAWQGIQLKRSVDLARDEFLSTHRPKIRIKNIWLMNEFYYDSPLQISVICVNYGTTDARIIEYGVDFLIVKEGATLPPNHMFSFKRSVDTTVKPGVSAPMPELNYALTEQQEIAIRGWKSSFYCVG